MKDAANAVATENSNLCEREYDGDLNGCLGLGFELRSELTIAGMMIGCSTEPFGVASACGEPRRLLPPRPQRAGCNFYAQGYGCSRSKLSKSSIKVDMSSSQCNSAYSETDEVYAQMTLQPVNTYDKEALLASELPLKKTRPQTDFFCKTLTASDTSTHGGFSVPRRAAEKIFPPLDFSMQPPAQELQARDLHGNLWSFRHIYRGQPKRHLLTTGWSLFASGKRLFAGDSVLFIRDEKQQLLVGIRRANRQPTNLSSSVLSSDSMHIGILAAAAHAATNTSPFTIFYNPRASPSEFVVPFAKCQKAVYNIRVSLGMRFRMMFETEESGSRSCMGTITEISDLDPVRWKNSQWRNLKVRWDEPAAGERGNRVSIWEIEPITTPFFICPPPFFRKRLRQQGILDGETSDMAIPWLSEQICFKDTQYQTTIMPGFSLAQWMSMQQNSSTFNSAMQTEGLQSVIQQIGSGEQAQILKQNKGVLGLPQQTQVDQLSKVMLLNQTVLDTIPHQQLHDSHEQEKVDQVSSLSQSLESLTQPQSHAQPLLQQQRSVIQNHQVLQTTIQQNQPQDLDQTVHLQPCQEQQQQLKRQRNRIPIDYPNPQNKQFHMSDLHQQHSLLQKTAVQAPELHPSQEQNKTLQVLPQHFLNSHDAIIMCQQPFILQQCAKTTSATQSLPQQKLQQHQQVVLAELPGVFSPANPTTHPIAAAHTSLLACGGAQSVVTDEAPTCSTSPSANNTSIIIHQSILSRTHQGNPLMTEQHLVTMPNPSSFKASAENLNVVNKLPKAMQNAKASVPVSRPQTQDSMDPQAYITNAMDTTSSISVCLSEAEETLQQSFLFTSFNQPLMFRDNPQDSYVHGIDPRNNVIFGVNIESLLGIPLTADASLATNIGSEKYHNSENMVQNYDIIKDGRQELSSSLVSHSFEMVPDMAFNSIDSRINDDGLINTGSQPPAPLLQRMRTYTKVHKRGAVGRSIDITRYSGYDELKHDIARMFSIEGQLEAQQNIGWKLVYIDHENDVLLVGDDPWEEFVNCVQCIKVLSPQEVQQMSLTGDLTNNALPNQVSISSDGGNAWRVHCYHNSG